jgi:hypothetical protein
MVCELDGPTPILNKSKVLETISLSLIPDTGRRLFELPVHTISNPLCA